MPHHFAHTQYPTDMTPLDNVPSELYMALAQREADYGIVTELNLGHLPMLPNRVEGWTPLAWMACLTLRLLATSPNDLLWMLYGPIIMNSYEMGDVTDASLSTAWNTHREKMIKHLDALRMHLATIRLAYVDLDMHPDPGRPAFEFDSCLKAPAYYHEREGVDEIVLTGLYQSAYIRLVTKSKIVDKLDAATLDLAIALAVFHQSLRSSASFASCILLFAQGEEHADTYMWVLGTQFDRRTLSRKEYDSTTSDRFNLTQWSMRRIFGDIPVLHFAPASKYMNEFNIHHYAKLRLCASKVESISHRCVLPETIEAKQEQFALHNLTAFFSEPWFSDSMDRLSLPLIDIRTAVAMDHSPWFLRPYCQVSEVAPTSAIAARLSRFARKPRATRSPSRIRNEVFA